MSTAKKSAPPPLSLPERPPSKVETGLQAAAVAEDAPENLLTPAEQASPEVLRERAINAMVAAGLSREFAEASFVLAEEGASAADVADAVGELEESGAPLCKHGCHGDSWAKQKGPRGEQLDAVGCEHGTFPRHPVK